MTTRQAVGRAITAIAELCALLQLGAGALMLTVGATEQAHSMLLLAIATMIACRLPSRLR